MPMIRNRQEKTNKSLKVVKAERKVAWSTTVAEVKIMEHTEEKYTVT